MADNYTCSAVVGRLYTQLNPADVGVLLTVENVDTHFGTVRFANGWLVSCCKFDSLYVLVN